MWYIFLLVFFISFNANQATIHPGMHEHQTYPEEGIGFHTYPNYENISNYLQRISHDPLVTVETLGESAEHRNISLVKISSDGGDSDKPIILIDGGMHGRERISVPGVFYVISRLLSPINRNMLDEVDWHLIPVVNPDSYTMVLRTDNTERKNLRQVTSDPKLSGQDCRGVDIDRNFGYQWNTVGASHSECSYIYQGPEAFSEVESQVIRDHVLKYKDRIKLYLNFQSYGPYLIYPWRFSDNTVTEDIDQLHEVGLQVADAISDLEGTNYTVGRASNVRFPAGGTAIDWVKSVGVKFSYALLFPSHNQGFFLKEDLIFTVVREMFGGIVEFHDQVVEYVQHTNSASTSEIFTWGKISLLSIFCLIVLAVFVLVGYLVIGKPKQ